MFDTTTKSIIALLARKMGCEAAIFEAVCIVESAGQVFADSAAGKQPLIRFEGHYFHRRLKGDELAEAIAVGLADPRAGAVKNPASQAARWKMLNRAVAINAVAALESVSWGIGQVMGAHWQVLGFASVAELVNVARSGAGGQLDLMARYIEKFGLVDELRRKDFAAFTRGYNGKGGIAAGYHTKMANAYMQLTGDKPVSKATGMLRMGSTGARVRELQALLVRAGHPIKVDGDYGRATRDAVKTFQGMNGLEVDGVAGPETMAALDSYRQDVNEKPGEESATELPEVKDAAKATGLIALIATARDQIAETAGWLFGLEFETAQTVANGLMAVSAFAGVALAAYAVYGWLRSRRTDEGDAHA